MSLGVRRLYGVKEAIHEVGHCNSPPYPRNQLLPKSVQAALGVLGMSNLVPVDLEDFDTRYGWILDISIDQQGGA